MAGAINEREQARLINVHDETTCRKVRNQATRVRKRVGDRNRSAFFVLARFSTRCQHFVAFRILRNGDFRLFGN